MKFRFYITDLFQGSIVGTNDVLVATGVANCEDFFVVDTLNGTWLQSEGDSAEIQELHSQAGEQE
jgi:hypothetical protein